MVMKSTATAESLKTHTLVKQGLLEAVKVQKSLNDRHPVRIDPHYERDPDEHEFYLLTVGHALAELPTCAPGSASSREIS
jgi:hypothetical protein